MNAHHGHWSPLQARKGFFKDLLIPNHEVCGCDVQHLGARLSAAGTALVDVRKESLGLRTEAEILCQAGKHGPVPYWEVLDSAEVHAKQLLNDIKILGTLPRQPRL